VAAFVDTNILIYAFVRDISGSVEKADTANALIERLTRQDEIIVSAQVLSEFSANAMRKGSPPLTEQQTSRLIDKFAAQTVIAIDASLVQLALHRVQQSRISYWDALIVEAAIRSGATILYTEDMDHGTRYGSLELRNPFLG
jgi:predicted nucleic acid-binding protein